MGDKNVRVALVWSRKDFNGVFNGEKKNLKGIPEKMSWIRVVKLFWARYTLIITNANLATQEVF